MITTDHHHHGSKSSISEPSSSQPANPDRHSSSCDGCELDTIIGTRYKCTSCDNYDLCESCYTQSVHNLAHPFQQINTSGAQPINLSACQQCMPKARSTRTVPTTSSSTSSPFFYTSKSIPELREYLLEREVTVGGVSDKEMLCRRAWDTHCDCMTPLELKSSCWTTTYLSPTARTLTIGDGKRREHLFSLRNYLDQRNHLLIGSQRTTQQF